MKKQLLQFRSGDGPGGAPGSTETGAPGSSGQQDPPDTTGGTHPTDPPPRPGDEQNHGDD